MLTVYFETYGCQMNVADSDFLADLLAQEGYGIASKPESADLVVVNTCSVREHAEVRARGRLAELAHARLKRKASQQLWVVGCMAQRVGERLLAEIPGVDRVVGAVEIEGLHSKIHSYLARVDSTASFRRPHQGVSSFVPVMRGCDNYCAYCIVPYVRGSEHSVPRGTILDTVRSLADSGVVEVNLLGQNVNSYRDPQSGEGFTALLRAIDAIDGVRRIRFTTSHPKDCSRELIDAVADLPKLCKHIHLPVQSGSTRILQRMNRRYSREQYLETIGYIRERMPHADITTDVMTGFPGETEDDFEQTLSLFRTVRYTTAFMFVFSPRTGTTAAGMADQIAQSVARDRLERLIHLQNGITREHYLAMVGKEVEVLVTERSRNGADTGWRRTLDASGF
jgi:tRNA-2-methylthio-N6-dimethylallyladenosine synthase